MPDLARSLPMSRAQLVTTVATVALTLAVCLVGYAMGRATRTAACACSGASR